MLTSFHLGGKNPHLLHTQVIPSHHNNKCEPVLQGGTWGREGPSCPTVQQTGRQAGLGLAVWPQPTSPCRVYTDVQQVLSHLTHPRFTFTQSEADADILYSFSHFKDYR